MPELTSVHIALLTAMIVAGAIIGWLLKGSRTKLEKAAINAGWRQQISAQRSEHERLTEQNKGLMEQIGQYQASNKDAKNRAKELSGAVQEAYSHRDKLQREIKEIRGSLEVAVSARDRLRSDIEASNRVLEGARSKDAHIAALANELRKWQDRVPPLIERFQQRNSEALQLKRDLASAQERIAKLEIAGNTDSLTNGSRDELQRIKGIGPAIQKTLNEIGIFSFQQLADMSEYDIDQVAKRLKGFHSRIYREDWIGQARELHAQEIGGQ